MPGGNDRLQQSGYIILIQKPPGQSQVQDLVVDRRIILKRTLQNRARMWSAMNWRRIGPNGGHFMNMVIHPRVPFKNGELLDRMRDYRRLKQNPA
jgi:hypothetical protein